MSILSNDIDIADDSRRICGQKIDDSEETSCGRSSNENPAKRRKTGHQLSEPMASTSTTSADEFTAITDTTGAEIPPTTVEDWMSTLIRELNEPQTINDLCPEVFQIIIAKYLKQNNWRKLVPLRLVCKYWRSNIDAYLASRHGFQYTGRVNKGSPPPVMNYYEFNAMLSFYPNMRQLIVKNFTVSDHLVAILRQNVPKLERMSLYGCRNLSWKGITIMAVRFPQLKFIDVSNCDLDENRLSILCENLQNLKIINAINPGRDVTGLCLAKLGPQIQDIWIGLNHLPDVNPALRALVSGNGKRLQHFGLIVANYQTTDWSIITDNMKHLKSLKLTFGSYRSGTLKHFAALKNLEFLVLAEDSRNENESVLTDDSLIPVIKGCTKLKSLAIAGTKQNTCRFTHRSIALIPRFCRRMEQIRFLNAHNIVNETLLELSTIPSLLVLHLSSMNGITTQGVSEFMKQSPKVRNIRISDCPNINESIIDVFKAVATNRPEEKIKVYLEGIKVTKDLTVLPKNLKFDIKPKPESESVAKPETSNNNITLIQSQNNNNNS